MSNGWTVRHTKTFYRELSRLPAGIRKQAEEIAFGEAIVRDPYLGGRVEKLRGHPWPSVGRPLTSPFVQDQNQGLPSGALCGQHEQGCRVPQGFAQERHLSPLPIVKTTVPLYASLVSI